jgi:hypothetical protein
MNQRFASIAIIGGGPAGGALGALLAKAGYHVGIFHTDKRPPLIVGESLLPAVIPMLQKLGIEDEVKSYSVYKPGATVCLSLQEIIFSSFTWADGRLPSYAYNTQRDKFDQTLLETAEKAGAKVFRCPAKLEEDLQRNSIQLAGETLEATGGFFSGKPDLIIDATGRNRAIARTLETPSRRGGRDDVAIFAHLDTATITHPGNIHLDYLTKGWSWRIPLPGKVSVGCVINPKHLTAYGDTLEAQYDNYISQEPSLRVYTQGAKRITPVVKYQNYQLISEQMYGPGWAMVGDAAGFIDPVFSTGLYLSMKGAFELFKAIESKSSEAFEVYQNGRRRELGLWQHVIDGWYNGRLFNLYRAGQTRKNGFLGRRIEKRVTKRLIRIFTGQAVDDPFAMYIFQRLLDLGKLLRDPKDLVID